jgi:outer membrane protein OmpA-like peptidoglycan-associated protein
LTTTGDHLGLRSARTAAAVALVAAVVSGSWLTARAVSPGSTETVADPGLPATAATPTSTSSPLSSAGASPSPSPSPSPAGEPSGAVGAEVRFAATVFRLSKASLPDLNTVAVHLKSHPEAVAIVIGLPDPVGPGASQATAWERAQSVATYLVTRGVAQVQVTHTINTRAASARAGQDVLGARVVVDQMD